MNINTYVAQHIERTETLLQVGDTDDRTFLLLSLVRSEVVAGRASAAVEKPHASAYHNNQDSRSSPQHIRLLLFGSRRGERSFQDAKLSFTGIDCDAPFMITVGEEHLFSTFLCGGDRAHCHIRLACLNGRNL